MSLVRFHVFNFPGPITEDENVKKENYFISEYTKYGKMTKDGDVTEISLLNTSEMLKFINHTEEKERKQDVDQEDEVTSAAEDVEEDSYEFPKEVNGLEGKVQNLLLKQNSGERNDNNHRNSYYGNRIKRNRSDSSIWETLSSYESINVDEIFQKSFVEGKLYNIFFDIHYKRRKCCRLTVVLDSECPRAHDFYKVVCHDLLEYRNCRFGDLFIVSKRIKNDSNLCLAYSIFKNFLQLYIFPTDAIPDNHRCLGNIFSDKILKWTSYPHQLSKTLSFIIAAVGVRIGDQVVPHINLSERMEQNAGQVAELDGENKILNTYGQQKQYSHGQQRQYSYEQQQRYDANGRQNIYEQEQTDQFIYEQEQIEQYAYHLNSEQNVYEQNSVKNVCENNYMQTTIQNSIHSYEQNNLENGYEQTSMQNICNENPEQITREQDFIQNVYELKPIQIAYEQKPMQNIYEQNPVHACKQNIIKNSYQQNLMQNTYENIDQTAYEPNSKQYAEQQYAKQNTYNQSHVPDAHKQNYVQSVYEKKLHKMLMKRTLYKMLMNTLN